MLNRAWMPPRGGLAIATALGTRRCALAAAACVTGLAACNWISGVGDLDFAGVTTTGAATGAGGEGGSSATAGGATPACAQLEREVVEPGALHVCGVRRLPPLESTGDEGSPSAICDGAACNVFLEVASMGIACAACADLPGLDCGPPAFIPVLAGSFFDPYARRSPPQLWLSALDAGSRDIAYAPLEPSSCVAGAVESFPPPSPRYPAINTGDDEQSPAISPDGRVLYFTRCSLGGATCRLHVARRSTDGGVFTEVEEVAGLRDGVVEEAHDKTPRPVWSDDGHEASALYFVSTRLGAPLDHPNQLDVFIAHRAPGSAWNAPFGDPALVKQLTTVHSDAPPVRATGSTWLWTRVVAGDADVLLMDAGCRPQFAPPSPLPFAQVNTAANELTGTIGPDGSLLLTRAGAPDTELFRASPAGDGVFGVAMPLLEPPIDHVAGTNDAYAFPTGDGRVLFGSDRGGAGYRVFVAAEGESPALAISPPAEAEQANPFVASDGSLWMWWTGGADPVGVVARALPLPGGGWGAPVEVEGLGHQQGRGDASPQLTADLRTLVFISTRAGGFAAAPKSSSAGIWSVWAATRSSPDAPWDEPFPLPELGTVNGTVGVSIDPSGCSVVVVSRGRESGFGWDLERSKRADPVTP